MTMRFDPRQPFTVVGVQYVLDADPDTPRLWRIQGAERISVATFGPAWDPLEVMRAAQDDRVELEGRCREAISAYGA